jgi:4-amino-4-deoxy-L-arabinose transferase-like glycosyltransferase
MKKDTAIIRKNPFKFISNKSYIIFLLCLSIAFSFFFTVYKDNVSPPCINSDEAAFGYNAYSLLLTGADEYGTNLPLRLKSFGDYKMPLYSYFSVPFVGILGLNELGIRALNILLAILLPVVIFYFVKELFEKEEVAIIASLFVSTSLGIGLLARQAHEALLAAVLITLASYFFIKFLKLEQYRYGLLFVASLFLALFSYQSSRLFAAFFFVFAIIYFYIRKHANRVRSAFLITFVIALSLFLITDIIYKPTRVGTLFLTSTAGFQMSIDELLREGGSRVFYNKLTSGTREVLSHEMQYFSPQFLAENGDQNIRFGFKDMPPMTPFAYLFIFVGMYFLIRNKERWRYFLLSLFFISPLTAALSWAEGSLTRSLFLFVPALTISAYGIYNVLLIAAERKIFYYIVVLFILIESMFLYYSWDFYLNHYPKRATVVRTWQCGYADLATYIKNNYQKYDTFYITQKNGEPYIFLLYYLQYSPQKYQKEASLTTVDKFGFGQVEKFDKFNFSLPSTAINKKNVVLIGYPDDFNQFSQLDKTKIKKITVGNEEIFWIYEL